MMLAQRVELRPASYGDEIVLLILNWRIFNSSFIELF
jgi:hypothetical protein